MARPSLDYFEQARRVFEPHTNGGAMNRYSGEASLFKPGRLGRLALSGPALVCGCALTERNSEQSAGIFRGEHPSRSCLLLVLQQNQSLLRYHPDYYLGFLFRRPGGETLEGSGKVWQLITCDEVQRGSSPAEVGRCIQSESLEFK